MAATDPGPALEDLAVSEDAAADSVDSSAPEDTQGEDLAEAEDVTPDVEAPPVYVPPPPSPAEGRGFLIARGALHVHNLYSHDACDGTVDEDPKNDVCHAQFREQVCTSGLDFVFMTDHPSNMSGEEDFTRLLYFNEALGDTLVKNAAGDPIANVMHCPESIAGPPRDVVLTVGFEGTHTMPLGLQGHLEPRSLEKVSLEDTTPESERQAVVDAIHEKGGIVAIAHSEEEELSAATIAGLPIDAMEQYNMHANFNVVLATEIQRVFALQPFLDGAPDAPPGDLALLAMLDAFPEAAIEKWYAVSSIRPITGVIGSDVHQNVTTDGYCTPGGEYEALCDSLVELYPALVAALKKGGPLLLSDGKRIDSYERVFRWLHNRVLVQERTAPAIIEALRLGRTTSVFPLFGELDGFDFHAEIGDQILEMGSSVALASSPKLVVSTPKPYPTPWAAFTLEEAPLAEIDTRILGFDATGAKIMDTTVTSVGGGGGPTTVTPDMAGRYHVEISIRPKHEAKALRGQADLASKTYRWLMSNPVYITP